MLTALLLTLLALSLAGAWLALRPRALPAAPPSADQTIAMTETERESIIRIMSPHKRSRSRRRGR